MQHTRSKCPSLVTSHEQISTNEHRSCTQSMTVDLCTPETAVAPTIEGPAMTQPTIERPGKKDILVGRGHTVFNHIGNRYFRLLVDLHIDSYVSAGIRSEKTSIVRKVIDILVEAGYRFMKPDKEGVFAELGMNNVLKKVGHALRDRSPLLPQHREKNLKTLDELKREGISPMKYAEHIVNSDEHGGEQDEWRHERYYTLNSKNRLRQLWVRPRSFKAQTYEEVERNEIEDPAMAASTLLKLSAASSIKRGNDDQDQVNSKKKPKKKTAVNNIKSINEIVVPAMQNGDLPFGGNWKFFPLPELQNRIDLGDAEDGWKLKLEPIAFQAEPITLNVYVP